MKCAYERCNKEFTPSNRTHKYCCTTHRKRQHCLDRQERLTVSVNPDTSYTRVDLDSHLESFKYNAVFAARPRKIVDIHELPEVEDLPASYLKRCNDYWIALIGEDQKGTRIA